jgi:hypothetical protein
MNTKTIGRASVVLFALAGCSSTATSADIASYDQLASETEARVASYRAAMMGTGVTADDCRRVHQAYDADVRPWLEEMGRRSGAMDGFMSQHGGDAATDMACTATTLREELDDHAARACSFASLAEDRGEVERHAAAMGSYAGHVRDRCQQMMRGDDTRAAWGPRMSMCMHSSGTGGHTE